MDPTKMSIDELRIAPTAAAEHPIDFLTVFDELARRLEKAEENTRRILVDIDAVWSFDRYQSHTHTWHTKQDFLEKWRAANGGAT